MSDLIDRYIPCPCIKDSNTNKYIPLWELDFKLSDNTNEDDVIQHLNVTSRHYYGRPLCDGNLYYDLLKKEVLTGKVIIINGNPREGLEPGVKVVVDSDKKYNHVLLDVIESIYYKEDLYSSHILKTDSPEISNWVKEVPELKDPEILKIPILEIRTLKPIYKTKKGYETEWDYKFKTYEE